MPEEPPKAERKTNAVEAEARRGRAAGLNMGSRYDRQSTEAVEDGWHRDPETPVRTTVEIDQSRSIIARNRSPDVAFDRSINPYRGCEHGCIYCFARPTHAQLGFSPGLDFETRLLAKPNAAELLVRAFRKPGYTVEPIAIGTNTDPYQPIEKDWRVMRSLLEVFWEHRHPLTLTTKGALLVRDMDLIGKLGRAGLLNVSISLTTLDNQLSRAMEPRAAAPARRLAMVRELSKAGVPVSVGLAPIVPGLTDPEIERMLQAGAEAGANYATYIMLRLPLEVSPLFRDWLEREFPDRADKIMARVREMHGGKDYDSTWFKRRTGEGVWASMVARRFELARKRHGLDRRPKPLRRDLFKVASRVGDQLSLGL